MTSRDVADLLSLPPAAASAHGLCGLPQPLDGRKGPGPVAAFECIDDRADGIASDVQHTDLFIRDLSDGGIAEVGDHADNPTSIGSRTCCWSPSGDVLAITICPIWGEEGESILFYDAAAGVTLARTEPIAEPGWGCAGAAWSNDGTALYVTYGMTIYKVDARTGKFASIYHSSGPFLQGLAVAP